MNNQEKQNALRKIQNTDSATNQDVKKALECSDSKASKIVSKLEEEGLVNKNNQGRSNILRLTDKGIENVSKHPRPTPSGVENVNTDEEQNNPWEIRPHNISVRAELSDSLPLLPKWFESWIEREDKDFKQTDDGYITTVDNIKARFTKNYVIVYVPEVVADDVHDAKDKVMKEASRMLEKLVDNTPVEIEENTARPMFSLRRQEIAVMDDPFAGLCVDSDEIDLQEQSYRDSDGELRFHIDNSNGRPELEFVSKKYGEEDADFYRREVIGEMIEDKESWRDLWNKASGGDLDRTERLLRIITEVIAIDKIDGLGQRDDENVSKQCECCERHRAGPRKYSKIFENVSEASGNSDRERNDERLNELRQKMKDRMEAWE